MIRDCNFHKCNKYSLLHIKTKKINTLCQFLDHVHCCLLFLVQFIFHNKFLIRCRGTNTVFNVTFLFEGQKPSGLWGIINLCFHLEYRNDKKYKIIFKLRSRLIFNIKWDGYDNKEWADESEDSPIYKTLPEGGYRNHLNPRNATW